MKHFLNKHTRTKEILEFKLNESRETFHFSPPTQIKRDWMIVLTSLEVYTFVFNITEENNNFKLYIFPDVKLVVFNMKKSEMRLKEN